jgi:hypothetical protein
MYPYFNTLTLATKKVAVCLQLLVPVMGFAATITSTNAGGTRNWTDPDTWVNGSIPTSSDVVNIVSGAIVTINTDLTLQSLTINGTLTFETTLARNVTINNNVIIDNTGTFQTGNTGNITTHALFIGGDLTNNGILDFSTNGNTVGANITFTGAANNTFGGIGTTTDILTIVLVKNTKTAVLLLNSSVFTVQDKYLDTAPFLTLTKGTIHFAGTYTLSSTVTNQNPNILCNKDAGFWLDNPNFIVLATTVGLDAKGLLKLEQGIIYVGSRNGNNLDVLTTTDLIITGGILNVASKLQGSPASFVMSGGTINVCTIANIAQAASFDITAKNFTISSGNIILNKPSSRRHCY